MAVLGLRFCARAFSSCSERGPLFFFLIFYLFIFYFWLCWVFISVWGLSPVAVSGGHSSSRCVGLSLSRPLIAEQRLQTLRLSSCGSRAQLLRGMWDLPRPGLEPVSPSLAGRFSTTAPPGKPPSGHLTRCYSTQYSWIIDLTIISCMSWEQSISIS